MSLFKSTIVIFDFLKFCFGVYYVLLAFSVFIIELWFFLLLKMEVDENLLNNKTIALLNLAEYPLI